MTPEKLPERERYAKHIIDVCGVLVCSEAEKLMLPEFIGVLIDNGIKPYPIHSYPLIIEDAMVVMGLLRQIVDSRIPK